jgi:hypothetical protein
MTALGWRKGQINMLEEQQAEETVEQFVLNDLPDNTWSVTWPGYEYVVVNDPNKARNLLKILFDEVGVDKAQLGVHEYNRPDKFETMHINEAAWFNDPAGAARYVIDHHIVVGCKFAEETQARKFKSIMERRLAWRRLSDKGWS